MLGLGNTISNSIWEGRIRGVKPGPQSNRDDKERWIRAKYDAKAFVAPLASREITVGTVSCCCCCYYHS